jgi:hypothetical protein
MKTNSLNIGLLALIGVVIFPAFLCSFLSSAHASEEDKVLLPNGNDDYATLVKSAESGDQNIDFVALRTAWLNSEYYDEGPRVIPLRKKLKDAARSHDAITTVKIARQILSINYTDMWAHELLREACKQLNDASCEEHHHFVGSGLLKSISKSGDGLACISAWRVVSIDEEYFIIETSGTKLIRQSLISEQGHACDKMEIIDENGVQHSFFFNVDSFIGKE